MIHADKDELNFPPSIKVTEALSSCDIETLSRYQKDPLMLEVLAKKHGVDKERIFLEQGVIGVIHRVFDYILSPQTPVILPELGFPYYHKLASHHKAKITTFSFHDKQNSFSYNIIDLLDKLQHKSNVLVLIDPEGPLGFSTSNNDLQKILEATPEETLVLLDQTHEGFREDNVKDITSLVNSFPNLLVARAFSKFYGLAGVRIAYALCGENVKEMINFNERYLGFDNIAQQVATAALDSEEHYKENAQIIREEKKRFNLAIRELPSYRVLETDNHSSIVVVPENQSLFLREQAEAAGIAIRHLGDYHDKLTNFYRVTMCPSDEMDRIIDLFESVSWLYDLDVKNSNAASVINTRDAGYTVNRKEIHCEHSNFLMGLHRLIVPPGGNVPTHNHPDQDELFEFHSRAYFELDGNRFEVQPGQWVNVKPGQNHYIETLPNRFARFIPLRFPYQPEKVQGVYNPTEK